jgi:hypothetical protein
MVGNAENGGGRRRSRWRIASWAVAALIVLLAPLVAMQFSDEWDWGLAAALLLVWINAAVGIIGDDEAINLIYFGVLVVGLIGAYLARFEPQGMARVSLAMAIAQMLAPVIVLMIPNLRGTFMEPPGVLGVMGLNAFFAMLFVGSALLFRKAAREEPGQGAV